MFNTPDTTPTTPEAPPQSPLEQAQMAREGAAQNAVQGIQNMNEQVTNFKSDLGTNFTKGAQTIESNNPDLSLTLSHDQVDALNTLKNNKSFALPDYLKSENIVPADPSNINDGGVKLSPTQTQDLITQLNRSTFTDKTSGLGVDQSKIGLTNEIKDAATQAFDKPTGGDWSRIYGEYSKGRTAVDSISDIVNIDKDATASDINKNLGTITKLGSTPEGKIILQNSINEFKNASGIDLSDPTKAVMDTLEKQAQLETAEKGTFGQQLMKTIKSPQFVARRIGGAAISILGVYAAGTAIRKALGNAMSGK